MYTNKVGKILSDDLQVLAEVYNITVLKKEPCWFSKLVEIMSLSKIAISKAQDRAYDLGLLNTEYEKVGRSWTNCWKLSREGKYLIKSICGEKLY